MGKKISQVSVKISKKNHEKKKQQLNSLMKVLKPKVYITDNSSFKSLVQELTGNGSITTPISSPSSPPPSVMNHVDSEISSCSMGAFSETSLESFEPRSNNYEQMFMEETATSVEYLLMNEQETDLFLGYQDLDLDSWLLNMEPAAAYSSCNIVSAQIHHEVSIYDYELSGLI